MFKPVLTAADLPPVGPTREDYAFDMKVASKGTKPFEMGKDVAAFANSFGGTILIGAEEDRKKGILVKYHPMSEAEANSTVSMFNAAVDNRCRPRPFIDPRSLPKDGGNVVAINVWPFPGQLVGVKIQGSITDGFAGDAFYFPIRSGTNNVPITPEQMPMFLIPEIRRFATMLDSIPQSERQSIELSDPENARKDVTLKLVDMQTNSFTMEWKNPQNAGSPITFTMPMDHIRRVWKNYGGRWRIMVDGYQLLEDGSVNLLLK